MYVFYDQSCRGETAIKTGIIFYIDGLSNLYRPNISTDIEIAADTTSLKILSGRLFKRGLADEAVLALPDNLAESPLCEQARAAGVSVSVFNLADVVEKPVHLRQQRWFLEDDSGNETWLGAAFWQAIKGRGWDTAVLIPLSNILIDASDVLKSLALHRRESFDLCLVDDRVCGAGWTIFQAELLQGLMQSHPEIMWARGGLAWALRKPLYPFKVGYFNSPRVRPSLSVDLRLNSFRALQTMKKHFDLQACHDEFSYAQWIQKSGWEITYADSAPLVVNVEPVSGCEGGCFNCAANVDKRSPQFLDLKSFKSAVADLSELRDSRWVFSGAGEPLKHPDIAEMVKTVSKFNSMLITSLMIPPSEGFPMGALDQIRISIDSLEAEGFAVSRPGCNWQNIESFIAAAGSLKKASPDHFPEVGVTLLRHANSEARQQAFLNYWKQVVKPVFKDNFFKWPFDASVEPVQWYQILGESELASEKGRTARVDFTPVKRRVCRHAILSTTILADGRVTICPFDYSGQFSMGSLREKSLGEIWQSDCYRSFRAGHLDKNWSHDLPCAKCRDWYHPLN